MRLTDWRGNEYGVGDTILYPRMSGRSVEMCEAVVERIWEAKDSWSDRISTRVSVRPTGKGARGFWRTDSKTVWLDKDGKPTTWEKAADDLDSPYVSYERDPETRALIEVTHYSKMARQEPVPIKPVTITNIENITVPDKRAA